MRESVAMRHEQPDRKNSPYGLLTEAEARQLILSLAEARGDRGFRDRSVVKILEWANCVRSESMMLELVLEGKALLDWQKGEPILLPIPEPPA